MERDLAVALVGVLGTLLGTCLGFALTIIYDKAKEKSQAKSEIQQAINEVAHVITMEEYPVAMNKLRSAMIKNSHHIKNENLWNFYQKWLTDPILQQGIPISIYSGLEADTLVAELLNIRL